jgi:hypothetical protein
VPIYRGRCSSNLAGRSRSRLEQHEPLGPCTYTRSPGPVIPGVSPRPGAPADERRGVEIGRARRAGVPCAYACVTSSSVWTRGEPGGWGSSRASGARRLIRWRNPGAASGLAAAHRHGGIHTRPAGLASRLALHVRPPGPHLLLASPTCPVERIEILRC